MPSIENSIMVFLHDGTELITERVSLDSEITLDVSNYSFQDRHELENQDITPISYNYAISSWIFIMDSPGLDQDIIYSVTVVFHVLHTTENIKFLK